MKTLKLQRLFDTGDETVGRLYLDDEFLCWTLEDTYRPVKVKHKTRIPAGTYKLALRKYGRWFQKLSKRFADIGQERGMLEVSNVPNYTDILIHLGNDEFDTSGCILLGSEVKMSSDGWRLVDSTGAYKKVYPTIADLMKDDTVMLEIIDEKNIEIDIDARGLDEIIKENLGS